LAEGLTVSTSGSGNAGANRAHMLPAFAALATGLFLLLATLALGGALPASMPAYQVAGGAVALLGSLVSVFLRPRWVFLGFLVGCMAIPHLLEQTASSLRIGFMNVFVQDAVFAYNLLLILARRSIGLSRYKATPFNRFIILHFLLGVAALLVGFGISRNPFDSTFGDFRRSYFYFVNFFVACFLVEELQDARRLRAALLIGAAIATLRGYYEAATGQFISRRPGDGAHILDHFEGTFITFLVFYGLAQLLWSEGARRWYWAAAAAAAAVIVILTNFRACWLSLAAGLVFLFLYLPGRQKVRLFLLGGGMAAVLALAMVALWEVEISATQSTIGEEIMLKANVKETAGDANVTWRFQSYANALEQWRTSPLIGTGLGEVLMFAGTTSTGEATLSQGQRVHNSFLWVLMTTGILGFAVFLFIQYNYLRLIARYLRHAEWPEGRSTVIACGAFYVSIMISAMFEIFLESAMPITVLSSSMALCMLTMFYDPDQPQLPTTA